MDRGLDDLFALVAGRFFRVQPRRRALAYVRGLLAPLATKNGWTLAEAAYKFEFIDAEYAAYQQSGARHVPSIVKTCVWMEISRSGFCDWRKAPESATARRRS